MGKKAYDPRNAHDEVFTVLDQRINARDHGSLVNDLVALLRRAYEAGVDHGRLKVPKER
jgi:hypothetical protein